jgi:rubrerythrin
MALIDWLRKQWLGSPGARQENQQKLLEFLCTTYLDELKDIANFTWHAERMYYPHLRERLRRIVAEEQSHVRWLGEKIRALGGDLPLSPHIPVRGRNTWENLRMDLQEERKDYTELLSRVRMVEHVDQEIAEGLLRLRQDERKHRAELLDMLMQSEPDAVPRPSTLPQELEKQKHAWLGQQKREWFDRRRAVWEADGKLIPWAEWVAQQEYEWTANELPNRELHWLQQLDGKTATEVEIDGLTIPRLTTERVLLI